ncbi:hypothetical protein Gpo141_00012954 [Globisporangium polare]
MELKLTDWSSSEKLVIQVDGNWKARAVARGGADLWHKQKTRRKLIGTIMWTQSPVGYDVDIAAGVDLTIIALFAIVLHETATDFPMFSGSH